MVTLSTTSAAAAQAIFDSAPGRRTWAEPWTPGRLHKITCPEMKRSDAEELIALLRVKATIREF